VHLKYITIYIQQDATLHILFISGNCSTRFGLNFHPSSGAHTTVPNAVDTVLCAPDDGWKYQPKRVEQFPDINKLCNVASCWIYIGILLGAHPVLHISRIRVNDNPSRGSRVASYGQTDGQQLGSRKCLFTNLRAHPKTGYRVHIFARNSEKVSRISRLNFRRTILVLVQIECKL
jgi:hypothetical protein